jgi:hypothetical protein
MQVHGLFLLMFFTDECLSHVAYASSDVMQVCVCLRLCLCLCLWLSLCACVSVYDSVRVCLIECRCVLL